MQPTGTAPGLNQWILHYKIVEKLGSGGMGTVFRAWDRKLERSVALKLLHSVDHQDPERHQRFLKEARAASALSHPGILSVYEINQHEGIDVLVMELVEGESLAKRLLRPLPVITALNYAVQIAQAMAKAHSAGVVHRDLKPANIMVTPDGHTKILDFGLAKLQRVNPSTEETVPAALTHAGQIVGTPAYMSPEQALGEVVDARSDVFSFGILLFECFTGDRPFQGATAFEILHHITSHEPASTTALAGRSVPESVAELVRQMLAKHRDQRPNMATVAQVLRAAEIQLSAVGSEPTQKVKIDVPAVHCTLTGTVTPPLPPVPPSPARSRILLAAGLILSGVAIFALVQFIPRSPNTAGSFTNPQDAFGLYRSASLLLKTKYRKENLDRAIEQLERAVTLNPKHAASFASLAEAYIARNQANSDAQWLTKAREHAARAVELDSEMAAAHTAVGMAAVSQGAFPLADTSLNKALRMDPRSSSAHLWLGKLRQKEGRVEEAANEFRAAMQQNPRDWEAASSLGKLDFTRHQYKAAAEAWETSIQASPDNPLVHRDLAAAYHMLDRYEDAAASLQRALEIEPLAATYNNLGTLRFFQGYYREALTALEKAVAMNANRYLYWGNLGDAYRWAPGHRPNAAGAYRKAIELAQPLTANDKHARGRIALYTAKSGDPKGALQQLSAIPQKDWDGTMYYRAAVIAELAGRRTEALSKLGSAISLGYALKEIDNDPELIDLRSDIGYHRLTIQRPSLQK